MNSSEIIIGLIMTMCAGSADPRTCQSDLKKCHAAKKTVEVKRNDNCGLPQPKQGTRKTCEDATGGPIKNDHDIVYDCM